MSTEHSIQNMPAEDRRDRQVFLFKEFRGCFIDIYLFNGLDDGDELCGRVLNVLPDQLSNPPRPYLYEGRRRVVGWHHLGECGYFEQRTKEIFSDK